MFRNVARLTGMLLSGGGTVTAVVLVIFGRIHLDLALTCAYVIALGACIIAASHKH